MSSFYIHFKINKYFQITTYISTPNCELLSFVFFFFLLKYTIFAWIKEKLSKWVSSVCFGNISFKLDQMQISLLNLCAVKLRLYRDSDIIWNSQQGKNLRGVASEKSMRGKLPEEKFFDSPQIFALLQILFWVCLNQR